MGEVVPFLGLGNHQRSISLHGACLAVNCIDVLEVFNRDGQAGALHLVEFGYRVQHVDCLLVPTLDEQVLG